MQGFGCTVKWYAFLFRLCKNHSTALNMDQTKEAVKTPMVYTCGGMLNFA